MEAKLGGVLCLLQLVAVATCALSDNIDTRQPIVRISPDPPQTNAYFGYSLVLHQVGNVPNGDRSQALSMSRIVVSAPNMTVPSAAVDNTGAVYTCPINSGPCMASSFNRLYDRDGNLSNEEKKDQFLGSSMSSDRGNFVVCAHRYVYITSGTQYLTGRCYASNNRGLTDFRTFEPCIQMDSRRISSAGVCQVGTSAAVIDGPTYGLGAPGYFNWRGVVVRINSNNNVQRQTFGVGTSTHGYQGYAVVAGRFIMTSRVDYATSVPRLNIYFGAVNIVANDGSLSVVSQTALRGAQMGEYYGFSLLSADLNGDGLDELLVGAPYYRANGTQPDTGRVYLYSNVQGRLTFVRTIEGFKAFSRFGYSMANLGDISGDGYDDVAIGAPFGSDGDSGTVYIYHSSLTQLLSINFQQEIVGSNLTLTGGALTNLTGFGSALASGVDVDANSYNDLAIGSFTSQKVFLLRTRPLARVFRNLTADPQIVTLETLNCQLGAEMLACFNVTACVRYEGTGLLNQLDFQFNVMADTRSIENRIMFSSMNAAMMETVSVTLSETDSVCRTYRAYVLRNVVDRFNPFILEFDVTITEPTITPSDGNANPVNFNDNPVLSLSGTREVQVETFKNCSGRVCVPDLRIRVTGHTAMMTDGSSQASSTITVGGVRSILVDTDVRNEGEDAFQASITITVPSRHLEIGRVFGVFGNNANRDSLTCTQPEQQTGTTLTTVTCSIGNPLGGPGDNVLVSTTITPRNSLVGNEDALTVSFALSSVNEEMPTTIDDGSNAASTNLVVNAVADVTLDSPGLVSPEQLSYANTAPNGTINNVIQLGPAFSVSFVVRNSGPSTVGTISLVINWPLNRTDTNNVFYFYPAQFTTSGTGATVTCSNANINPNNYVIPDALDESDQEGGTVVIGGKRRRRRNAVPYVEGRKLRKRQMMQVTEAQTTSNQTISCADAGPVLNCVPITCTIIGLQGTSNAQARINIIGYIDERFFSQSNDRFSVVPSATVEIIGGDFIIQPNADIGKNSSAIVRIIPAENPIIPGGRRSVPWWAILIPILAAFIIVAVVAAILWALGFFKRQKHIELKQRKEELENLENHGVNPSGSTENMLNTGDGTNL